MSYKIFVIDPGSTSTKLAFFEDKKEILNVCVSHDAKELISATSVNDQLWYRMHTIEEFLRTNNIDLHGVDAIVGRGGSVLPVKSGTYEVNEKLLEDTVNCVGGFMHPSILGIQLGKRLQTKYGGRLFMVDPICVDEYCDEARFTGIKGITRNSIGHALNLKGTAKKHCLENGIDINHSNFIVGHIDGGITICAMQNSLMIDGNNACGGDGPFTPTRTGSIAVIDLLNYIEAGHSHEEIRTMCAGAGGFVNYFNDNDGDNMMERVKAGDELSVRVWNAFCYNLAKAIGSMSCVLSGQVDGIILTGRYVRFKEMIDYLTEKCGWIAPIYVYQNEVELEAMAEGAYKVLTGESVPKIYK